MTPEQELADLRTLCRDLWTAVGDVAIYPGLEPRHSRAWVKFDRELRARGILPTVKA